MSWLLGLTLLLSAPHETYSLHRDSSAVILPVTFYGQTYMFLFDSGSSTHQFDLALRLILGQPMGEHAVC